MARHDTDMDARAIDTDRARGRIVGTAMSGAEWCETLETRKRYVRRVGLAALQRMSIAEIDDAVRAEVAREKEERR